MTKEHNDNCNRNEETAKSVVPQKSSVYDRYQHERQRTETLLKNLCAGNHSITIDTTKCKCTVVSTSPDRKIEIYYRKQKDGKREVRIDVPLSSDLYTIAKELESDGIAYQRDSANPRIRPKWYAFFVDEENEEAAYSRLLGIEK